MLKLPGQSLEDTLDITTLLHRDDTRLIFLIDPNKESLLLVVEDTTALRPVTLHTSHSQVAVTRHEQEVVINKLLTDLLIHTSQWVVAASQITLEPFKGSGDQLLNSNTLFSGDSGRQTKSLNGTTNTDPGDKNSTLHIFSLTAWFCF